MNHFSNKQNPALRVIRFYIEGFRSMTLGKTLWLIILIKLFIMFCVLKPFFFPRFLGQFGSDEAKQEYVTDELVQRAIIP
ncbi:MAG: DUF4492 domain-containing protein [Tannerellaceae bacterium]|jgi:hypothetical protein|nr:DUF4492 domain-containing protein [Tannerellaceae bacterium]